MIMESPARMILSVIIPVYNSGRWLSRCLDSVLVQAFPHPWELILVDDGSTDDSGMICDTYAGRSTRIKVFHIGHQGASLARKQGLEMARGAYVTFIDSDDYVCPGYFENLYQLSIDTGCSIAACAVGDGQEVSEAKDPQVLTFDELMPRFFKYEFWGFVANLYTRRLFDEIPFPQATLSEDYFVMARLFAKEKKMAFLPASLYCYEKHEASLSHLPISDRSFDEFENVRDVFDFTAAEMPAYREYALSNVLESSVKLLLASGPQKKAFREQRKKLASFLADHRTEILSCKPLLPKTRLLAFLCSFL